MVKLCSMFAFICVLSSLSAVFFLLQQSAWFHHQRSHDNSTDISKRGYGCAKYSRYSSTRQGRLSFNSHGATIPPSPFPFLPSHFLPFPPLPSLLSLTLPFPLYPGASFPSFLSLEVGPRPLKSS